MRPETRHPIHMGINFVVSPPPILNPQTYLAFQQALISHSVDFSTSVRQEQQQESRIVISRETPPLRVVVIASATQPIGQLLILATPEPLRSLEYFIQEAEAVVEAFTETWPIQRMQIIKQDAALRCLYETDSPHAFQELWEQRLGQPPGSLAVLGPVWGGGLRFVIPPQPTDQAQIEVKIESYLRDSRKIFIEVQFAWIVPLPPGSIPSPRDRLMEVDRYIENQVHSFMKGGEND